MRSLSSPGNKNLSPATAATPASRLPDESIASLESMVTPMDTQELFKSTPCPHPSAPSPFNTTNNIMVNYSPLTSVDSLIQENNNLRGKVSQLEEQAKIILDHSIESDTRLLQYSSEVFVANIPHPTDTSLLGSHTAADDAEQCGVTSTCRDERCAEDRSLIVRLKTTIEVLEAELNCLRAEVISYRCREEDERDDSTPEWNIVSRKNKCHPSTKTGNRCEALPNVDKVVINHSKFSSNAKRQQKEVHKGYKPKINSLHSTKRTKTEEKINRVTVNGLESKTSLNFKSVIIESDSHGRNLANLIQGIVSERTRVSAFVKPGAKLLDVVSAASPPQNSCFVILAGTNDLADGEQNNIYQHLEKILTTKTSTSGLVIATLPRRHDLPPYHPVNKHTELVNGYLRDITSKYSGAVLVDINNIGRRMFTRHGMHLRMPGKRLLARLLVDSLAKVGSSLPLTSAAKPDPDNCSRPATEPRNVTGQPSSVSTSTTGTSLAAGPSFVSSSPAADSAVPPVVTLPHESYAEAVKQTGSPRTKESPETSVFLWTN